MKILVTGGAGFIGSHVADAYIAAGHEVAILDDFSTGNEANVNREAEVLRLDVRDKEGVAAAIAAFRPEVVNHHAAQSEVPKSVADPGFDATVNIVGGLNVLRTSIDAGVRKFIFISTGSLSSSTSARSTAHSGSNTRCCVTRTSTARARIFMPRKAE